jgi:hypothetical protein
MPESQVEVFGLDEPDRTGDDMLHALAPLGGATEIPRRLVNILGEYFDRYTDEYGAPVFSGGSYFTSMSGAREPTERQRELDIVESFATSVTLSLATIGFVKIFRQSTRRVDLIQELDRLTEMASTRLTAALVGLLRSFSVNVFDADGPFGRNLCNMVNQDRLPPRAVITALQRELRQTIASFREVVIGSGQIDDLESPSQLFECGWSWGIVEDAPLVEIGMTEKIGEQRSGFAEAVPYLYFTVIAMDAIEDLFSERTRLLGLLNEEQQRLSRALQLRSDLTRSYWATIATFGAGQTWPLEDIPWRTTDGEESDYYTLQVTSLAVKGLTQLRGADAELMRIGRVLAELADRARITRRPVRNDAAVALHLPGLQLRLNYGPRSHADNPDDPTLLWTVSDFAPLLLQRMATLAGLVSDARQRSSLLEIADRVWDHLLERRLRSAQGRNLWDYPAGALPELPTEADEPPSWYYTQRVVQALVTTANVLDRPPLRSERMTDFAAELLSEAEHLFDRQLMRGIDSGSSLLNTVKIIRLHLSRARELLADQPGTAVVLASNALNLLSEISAATQKAHEVI